MRSCLFVLALASGACHRNAPAEPPPSDHASREFDSFEREFLVQSNAEEKVARARGKPLDDKDIMKSYRGVFIGPSGVVVDRKLVASLSELQSKRAAIMAAFDADAKAAPSFGFSGLTVTFDLGDLPASVGIDALRLFVGRETYFDVRVTPPTEPNEFPRASRQLFVSTLRGEPSAQRDAEQLSVLLGEKVILVGLAHAQDFQEIADRDTEKLESVLREQKQSPTFSNREDIEISASSGNASDVLAAMEAAHRAGFSDIAVLPPDKLSAKAPL